MENAVRRSRLPAAERQPALEEGAFGPLQYTSSDACES